MKITDVKKIIVKGIIVCAIILGTMISCDMSGESSIGHEHNFNLEVVDVKYVKASVSCTEAAVYYKSCECGEASTTETFIYGTPLGHSYNGQGVCIHCGQENILPETFTVDSNGNEVQFAKGNLWYNTSTEAWDFEESQLDYQTSWDANHIDKFYWSKEVSVAVAQTFSDPSRSTSDKFFAADNFTVNGYTKWGTLSHDEWDYLLKTRSTNVTGVGTDNARFARVIVNGVKGLLLFPDIFVWNISTMGSSPALINSTEWLDSGDEWSEVASYTLQQFEKQEEAGIVFLPCAGYRGVSSLYDVGSCGYYWTSSPRSGSSGSDYVDDVYFGYDEVSTDYYGSRNAGLIVRLVSRVE